MFATFDSVVKGLTKRFPMLYEKINFAPVPLETEYW